MMTIRPALMFAAGVLAAALGNQAARACQCGSTPTPAEAYELADTIVSGTVESITDQVTWWRGAWMRIHDWFADEPLCGSPGGWVKNCGFQIVIAIDRSFKGQGGSTVRVLTGRGGGDCAYLFQQDIRYLVYARRLSSGELTTSICDRTRPLNDAAEDLSFLASPKNEPR